MTDEMKNDGGPAFPSEGKGHGNPQYHSPGMTLRDWFAGQAMMAILGNPSLDLLPPDRLAQDAYNAADAMLEGRAK